MIPHRYTNASDNIAQFEADCIGRQEVTVDWYLDNMCDAPVFRWTSDEDHGFGLDPWRFYADLPIDPEDVKERGWRLFVQRKDMPGVVVIKHPRGWGRVAVARELTVSERGPL